ncbi:MAG: hypothetical protein P8Y44_13215 [Acidobacteriota bacterium]
MEAPVAGNTVIAASRGPVIKDLQSLDIRPLRPSLASFILQPLPLIPDGKISL